MNTIKYKIVLLGDNYVGKSSLCKQLEYEPFDPQYKQTLGVDFYCVKILDEEKLDVWDINGQSIYGKLMGVYLKNSHGCVIVCDAINYSSIDNIKKWLKIFKKYNETCPCYLIFNKMDLINDELKEYVNNYIDKYVQTNGIFFTKIFRTSAKKPKKFQQMHIIMRIIELDISDL